FDGRGEPAMVGGAAIGLENHHQAVAGRLADIAVVHLNDLEKGREIRLHQLVEPLGLELLGELGVAGDVEEEDRHLDALLLQLRGVRVLLEQALDGLGDELRQLPLELLQELQALARLLEILQGGGQLRVLRLELRVGLGQAPRHVVERAPELAQLVARRHRRPGAEVARPHAAGDVRELLDGAQDDAPHGDGEDGAGGHDGEDADGELTVPVPRDLREHGLHRAGDAHDGAYLVIAAVAALALLLVADRREQGEVPRAVARLERLLGGHRLDRPGEERIVDLLAGRPRHLPDVAHDVGRQPGVLVDLHGRAEVGEGFDARAPIDVEGVHRRVLPQLLDHCARDVGALLEHRPLDGGYEGGREPSRRDLVLLDQQSGLALDGEEGGHAEADDEYDDDEEHDLQRERRAEHGARLSDARPARWPAPARRPRADRAAAGARAPRARRRDGPSRRTPDRGTRAPADSSAGAEGPRHTPSPTRPTAAAGATHTR